MLARHRLVVLALALGFTAEAPAQAAVPDFDRDVAPLIKTHCLKCHGASGRKANLDLRTKVGMLQGGESGPALVLGSVGESLLIEFLDRGEMPPKPNTRLSMDQIRLLKEWIAAGAPGGDAGNEASPLKERAHWAFQRLGQPVVPQIQGGVRSPVDAFVLSRLREKGLSFAPDADRRTLIRRASLDLLGLPPSPEAVEAFVHDANPGAYERLIDRLLASPHFGERWGRHWLDGAGFSDILGCDNDAARLKTGENKWRYRDYVIRALNADKPFDQFLTEQLAGDELVDWRAAKTFDEPTRELLIATGFLRNSADDTDENELNTLDIRHGVLQRTGEMLVGNLLGLTLQCAKCHDHKYEPIPQRDYYGVLALLQPAFNPDSWVQPAQRQVPDVSPAEKAEIERANADLDRLAAEVAKRLANVRRPYEERLSAAKLATVPEPIRADVQSALRTPADQRNEVFKYLAGKFEATLAVKPEEVSAALDEKDRTAIAEGEKEIAALKGRHQSWGHLQVVYDVGPPTPTHLLRRGNHLNPGAVVRPGFLSILTESPADLPGERGRRLALARWLNDDRSPAGALVLRVRVNRIWQHLFGRGIVETPDNFGLSGTLPTHPELLEWLAGRFVADGKRLKPFLKLLVTSAVYRQASVRTMGQAENDPDAVDPDNVWLHHMRLRRLESEAVRDCLLAVSGKLDRTVGGPPVPVDPKPDGTFVIPDKGLATPTSAWRRSVYLLARRNYHPSLLEAFDQPNLATNCTRRPSSAVVLQSLAMLNDGFVLEQAEALAARASRAAPGERVAAAFAIALGRPPSATESSACAELLDRHEALYRGQNMTPDEASLKALGEVCHALLNTSEFLYVP